MSTPSPTPTPTPEPFVLGSSAFANGGHIPTVYSCHGADVSPPLAWQGVPAGTQAFAIVVLDPDARDFVHWVLVDIAATRTDLPQGVTGTTYGRPGRNSFGTVGYRGPCPPSGTHHYVFTLYALSHPLSLGGAPTAAQVQQAARAVTLAKASLTGRFGP